VVLTAGLILSVALTVAAWLLPEVLGISLLLPAGRRVVVWTVRARVIAAVGLLVWAPLSWCAWRGVKRRPEANSAGDALLPLTLLPLSLAGCFLTPAVHQAVAANVLFFLPVVLATTSLFLWLRGPDSGEASARFGARGAAAGGVVLWIFYALVGWYFAVSLVKRPGDTGHYIVQAESLYHDHDLDLRNNLGPQAERKPEFMHISPYSRGGHLYSWHSIGLPLLLAPFVPGGAPARHLLLGLFSGLCFAGLWRLCGLFRASRRWSLAVLLLFLLSRYWGVYSALCLPEVAGAALTTWGVVAILSQRSRPWLSAWVCVATCAYLPWLHTRFIPVSGAIVGIYVAAGLAQRNSWRPTLHRLGFTAAAYGIALAGFFAVQFTMFDGGLPTSAGILLSYPLGIWFSISHRLGLLAVLPLLAGMLGAALWILFRDPRNRLGAATALLLTGVVLATSCAWPIWFAGATYPGRFLVVVAPLFLPCLARALGTANPVARWWMLLLGLIPCFQFVLVLLALPEMGDLALLYDHLNGLLEYVAAADNGALQPLAIALLGGTGLLLFLDPARRSLALATTAAMVLVVATAGDVSYGARLMKFAEKFNARRLAEPGTRLEGAAVQAWGDLLPLDLFQVSDRFHGDRMPSAIDGSSGPEASNDWADRGHRWTTLAPPIDAGEGWRACRLTGSLDDGTSAHWAVREGSKTLFEGPLPAGPGGAVAVTARIRCRGAGRVSIAMRFEDGRGGLREPAVAWTPFSHALLNMGGFSL
jgi:hypothetical protein